MTPTRAAAPCEVWDRVGYEGDRWPSDGAPTALLGAQIAWSKLYAGTEFSAIAYSTQWNNPFPAKTIAAVDLIYGPDRRGVPALLTLTAASAR